MGRGMEIVHITSRANPRLKQVRSLQQRKARQQHAQLLLEGVRLIEDAFSAGFPPALLLFDPDMAAGLSALLARAQQAGTELLSAPAALLAEAADTVTPPGVLAVASWPTLPPGQSGLALMVDGVRDPGNLGTLLRSAAAAGVDQVILLPGVTDVWAPKVLRAGMGAHFRVAIRQAQGAAQAAEWIAGLQPWLATAAGAHLYTAVDWTRPSALIIGGEARGAGAAAGVAAGREIRIPLAGGVESLNAAVAGSIILFEARRQRLAAV